jgi:hypothetical protein
MNYVDRSNIIMNPDRSNIIIYARLGKAHASRIESQSILAGGVGLVRSQFLEFGDDY